MNLFVFGLGYTASRFVARERARFAGVAGTVREPGRAAAAARPGLTIRLFGPDHRDPAIPADLAAADAVLVSVPPDEVGDPVLASYRDALFGSGARWIGYLSTIGVYGDQGGAWIDEDTPVAPSHDRTRRRVEAERDWLALGRSAGKAVQVFRLSGIYGPGRNALTKLAGGRTQRVVKPGQVFNRIHVDDIAATLAASLERPRGGAIYNVTDDEPAPPQDVIAEAAALLGVPPPPEVPYAEAPMSPMARSFYGENKRVRNALVKAELGVTLQAPTYREGLRSLLPEAALPR